MGEELTRFHMVRDLQSHAVQVSGWARWRVFDGDELVGIVAEDREWIGYTWGPATYTAVHNPGAVDWGARWRAEGFETALSAFEALVEHLSGPAGEGRA